MEGTSSNPRQRAPLALGDPLTQDWRRINEQDIDITSLFLQVAQLRRDSQLAGRTITSFGHFPFRIYSLPTQLRTIKDPATDWLKFCVRSGYAPVAGVPTLATNGDGEAFGYDNTFPLDSGHGVNEVQLTLTAGVGEAQHWFWLDTATNAITHGAALPASGVVPLGFVDTTDTANKMAYVRQIQYGDIQSLVSSGGSSLVGFKIANDGGLIDGGDYWRCFTWDGTTLGTNAVNVYKPHKIRAGALAIASETIYRNGNAIVQNYTYAAQTIGGVAIYYVRTVTVNSVVIEKDVVEPDALAGDLLDALPDSRLAQQIGSATVASGGAATYAVNDVLTLVGGTGTAATLTITTVSAGLPTAVKVTSPGNYTVLPSLTACATTGGGGLGATFNLTALTGYRALADGKAWAEI